VTDRSGSRDPQPGVPPPKEDAAAIARRWVDTFVALGGFTGSHRTLDVGCGAGRMALGIGERFGFSNDYLGFDIKADDIAFCNATISARHANFTFLHLDARNPHYNPRGSLSAETVRFPAEDGSFDFAFATSVFTHMPGNETENYVREAARCLRPGGVFLATFFWLDGVAREAVAAGRARFNFTRSPRSGTWEAFPDRPGDAVAHELSWIEGVLAAAGFVSEYHPGEWTRARSGRHSQDIVIGRRPDTAPSPA